MSNPGTQGGSEDGPPNRAAVARIVAALTGLTRLATARPGATLLGIGAATVLFAAYAVTHLGVDTDNRKAILADDLLSEARAEAFEKRFGGLADAILVVVDAPTAPEAQDAARALVARLEGEADVTHVEAPGTDPFFEAHALLYLGVDELESFADELVAIQPFIAELERTPDLPTLARLLELGLNPPEGGPRMEAELPTFLDQLSSSIDAVEAGRSVRVSWAELMTGSFSFGVPTRQTIIVQPLLRTDELMPAAAAIETVERVASELGYELSADPAPGSVGVRLTGYPVLNHEEIQGLLVDVGAAGVASFLLVLCVLGWSMRSARLVGAAAITLLVGLVWTAAYAAATVVDLNLISVTFAVLFVGLGVDFAIHLGMHVTHAMHEGRDVRQALLESVAEIGPALLLCTVSTAIGFLSFMPTDFRGVAELGIVSSGGMVVIFALTLTLFPALLVGPLRVTRAAPPPRIPFEPDPARRPGLVAAVCLLVGAGLGIAAVGVRFDANVVNLRNPNTPSVLTWNELLEDERTSPWYADVLARDVEEAVSLKVALEALPEIDRALTVADLVPEDQEEKLEILSDLAFLFDSTGATPRDASATGDPEAAIRALVGLQEVLGTEALGRDTGPLGQSVARLRTTLAGFLADLEADPSDPSPLRALESTLLAGLPAQIGRLRNALEPSLVTRSDLPEAAVARMLSPDGAARIQAYPAEDPTQTGALDRFVAAVRSVSPEAVGLPVNVVAFGEVTARSLREALLLALALVSLLLLVLGRRPVDVALTLAPLVLASVGTVGVMALFDIRFNFANVIVLPLLLGTGVDSGIHLVSRARREPGAGAALARTVTGRAVFFSAITTLASFGTLATSAHRGISGLGLVLLIGMGLSILANLVALPAFLALQERSTRPEPAPDLAA